jgi:hypothetical protein
MRSRGRWAWPYSWPTTATGCAAASARARVRRLEGGQLGVTVVGPRLWRPVVEWCAPALEIRATEPVAAGIDGEAVRLQPPIRFRIRPQALRVRIARRHPGASPSAFDPGGTWGGIRALAAIVAGRTPV